MPLITVFWKLRQEDYSECEVSISYIAGWGYSVAVANKTKELDGNKDYKENVQIITDLLSIGEMGMHSY